jgi:hypothetical protein
MCLQAAEPRRCSCQQYPAPSPSCWAPSAAASPLLPSPTFTALCAGCSPNPGLAPSVACSPVPGWPGSGTSQSAPVLHLSAVAARPPRAAAVRPDRGPPEPRPADPARHRRHLVPPGKPPPALGRLPPRPDRSGWPAHRLGHCWVVVGILVKLPVAPHRHVCLPVLPACGTHATPTTPSWCWPTR